MDVVTIEAFGKSYRINNPGGRIGSFIAQGQPYERRLLYDIYNLVEDGTIDQDGVAIDVGAHVGNHALFMAAICGLAVDAFEPFPKFYRQLNDNIELNRDELQSLVAAFPVALGDRNTTGLYRKGMKIQLDRGGIPVMRLDDEQHTPVSVIKVDVEGMEPEVLRGAVNTINSYRPVIYAETHTRAASGAVGEVLRPLGYHITRKIKMGSMMERWEAQ